MKIPFYGQNNSKLFAVESVCAAIEINGSKRPKEIGL